MLEDDVKILKFRLEHAEDKLKKVKWELELAYHLAFKAARQEQFVGTEEYFEGVRREALEHIYNAKCHVEDILDNEMGGAL